MMEEYLWGFANPVPLRAVFTDGSSTPVIGFAAVRAPVELNKENSPVVTIMAGIAIFNRGLTFCESCTDFIGYAEPMVVDLKTGEIKENEPEELYQEWYKENQSHSGVENNWDEGNSSGNRKAMELIRTGNGEDSEQAGNEPGESVVDEYNPEGGSGPAA